MPVALIASRGLAELEADYREILKSAGFEIVVPCPGKHDQLTQLELLDALCGVDAVIAGAERYPTELFAARPDLRVVARVGVGYDSVDVEAATTAGVVVTIAPNTNHGSVAEHTFALLLGLTRYLAARHQALVAGDWPRLRSLPLRGRTLGLAGLGRTGRAVAARAVAFEMRVMAYEPMPDASFCELHGITLVSFDRLLAESDYLSLHLPLMPETHHLIQRKTLAQMKPTAMLINTARGGLVCEDDLVDALRGRRIAAAGLDVFEREPLPSDHALRGLDNVVLSPHAAGLDTLSLTDMARSAAEAIISLRRGDWPAEKIVNPQVRARFAW